MLNIGCGEMLTDFGFLRLGVKCITALDVKAKPESCLEEVVAGLRAEGYGVPRDWPARLAYRRYDGRTFPFPNDSFDFVFSWSAFEHIEDVPGALAEIRRVVRADGRVFIQVYPWIPSFTGVMSPTTSPSRFSTCGAPPSGSASGWKPGRQAIRTRRNLC
jgi:SAM-dependent methyltransferase